MSQSCSMQPLKTAGLTFQRSCQHAARSFHKIVRGIRCAGEAVGNLRAMKDAFWPVALEAGVCGVCVNLRVFQLVRAVWSIVWGLYVCMYSAMPACQPGMHGGKPYRVPPYL